MNFELPELLLVASQKSNLKFTLFIMLLISGSFYSGTLKKNIDLGSFSMSERFEKTQIILLCQNISAKCDFLIREKKDLA